MRPEYSSSEIGTGGFRTTCWSVVLLSAQSQAPGSQAALAELCRLYWYPLYAFVRYRGHSPQDAQDLTQGFFLHLLEHRALTHVDPLKGKFRSFMIASLQNYLSHQAELARRLKRGGETVFVYLDLERAAQGKTATFDALKPFLDPINSETLPSYEQVAVQLKVSIGAVKTLIHRLRKQHAAFVREEISRTVADSADVDAEVHELCEALIAAEGWVVP